ncbi:MAG: cyclic nucleotide-binding domain-containing protein [Pseudomonadales bacterium]
MYLDVLKRLPAFVGLPAAALEALAAGARQLRLPPRRWLVRSGRALAGHYYLLEGRVRVVGGAAGSAAVVAAGSTRAREPIYPGAREVETLSSALFLRVDPHAPDVTAIAGLPDVVEVRADDDLWQQRFLLSPLMQRLDPAAWQQILRAMTTEQQQRDECIIAAGAAADRCYVLCSGRAEIIGADGATAVATLSPGSLFGEDALITGRVRNASVWMRSSGSTVSLPAELFATWLLHRVVQPLAHPDGRRLLSLDRHPPAAALHLPVTDIRAAARTLSPEHHYAIVGATHRERALAAFLLTQQGLDARPVGRGAS